MYYLTRLISILPKPIKIVVVVVVIVVIVFVNKKVRSKRILIKKKNFIKKFLEPR